MPDRCGGATATRREALSLGTDIGYKENQKMIGENTVPSKEAIEPQGLPYHKIKVKRTESQHATNILK